MFSSNPLDKNCIGPDCSSGRNNGSNRFPVGITSLGDENQQIRIQLAVNKYNNSTSTPLSNRCAVTSPFRHSFLKNSLKAKNYEWDTEGTSKNSEKKNGNQYEGVGAFPTIHLKKKAVRYRPIRRFNDVKVSYPELPVNRFLSNLPEACLDLKSSTRSVLDVLEDLSGKKVHSKEDSGINKPKSKGLAGDYHLNPNAVYKPLFAQKPKISSVLTRDSTTQTLSPFGVETPSPQSDNLSIRNDSSDPRAELRRKLAKQNNEIFASLSSSISSFALKRKIDKILPTRFDGNLSDESATKKSKTLDHQSKSCNGNGILKSSSRLKMNSCDSIPNKTKLKEKSSPTSPNKDRLTTIFLDMQNTSPKAQIFQKNTTSAEEKLNKNGSQMAINLSNRFTHTTNSFENQISNPIVNGSLGAGAAEISIDKNGFNNSSIMSSAKASSGTKKSETEQCSKPAFNFPTSKTDTTSDITKLPTTAFQFGINTNTSNISFSKTSVESNAVSISAEKTLGNGNTAHKKDGENQVFNKSFSFGSSSDKPDFSSFKFGTNVSTSSVLNTSPKDLKAKVPEAPPIVAAVTPNVASQFSFGTTTTSTTSPSQSFTVQFGNTNAQNTTTTCAKSFSFGQNATPTQENSNTKVEEKAKASDVLSTFSTTTTTQSQQCGVFSFGQKPEAESTTKSDDVQNAPSMTGAITQASNLIFSSPSTTSLNTGFSLQPTKNLFTFGQKAEIFTTSTTPVTTAEEKKLNFTFDQKPDANQNKAQGESGEKSTNLSPFDQKSVVQNSQTPAASANVTSSNQTATSQPPPIFGQSVSTAMSTPQVKLGQVSASQISGGFGAKSEGNSLSSVPAFSQGNSTFSVKAPLFKTSDTFGSNTSQASTSFGTSTSTGSGFGFTTSATTQYTPAIGVSSAPTSTPTFGNSSTSQSGFGSSSVTQPISALGSSVSNNPPTFGVSNTTQSTSNFSVSSTAQPASSFGATSTTQSIPAFGTVPTSLFGITSTKESTTAFGVSSASQSTPTFGVSSTTQPTPAFGASSGFGVSASSQANTMFGAPNSTQSTVRFGAQENTTFGTSTSFIATSTTQPNTSFGAPVPTSSSAFGAAQPSFNQPFDNKATTSPRQTTSIFGSNPTQSFSPNSAFSSNQNSVFGQKPSAEGGMFDQNKIQTPAFGTTSQTFGAQNKFSFGSTTNTTGFTNSAPNVTSAPVFGFGGANTSGTFTFGSSTSAASNAQTPFAFKNPANEPFQFGANQTKEGSGFGGGSSSTFNFGSQVNNNAMTEQKPTFNFGNTQVSSTAPFAFGTTPSPSVFSFGSSTPASSGSSFNFGTPTPGGPFGQTATPSQAAPFAVPGTFSIGSGSSQSRPRATSRPRRRP